MSQVDAAAPLPPRLPPPRPPEARRGAGYPALRTIVALILREMSTRFGRQPGGYLWAVLQPLGVIVLLAYAYALLARNPALGTSFFLFKATGLLIFQLYNGGARAVGRALSFSRPLLAYPGVAWIDALLARFALNTLVFIIVMVLILGGGILVLDLWLILDWGMILSAVGLTLLLGFGIGVLNCYLTERFDIWSSVWAIASAPLLISSGVLFLFDDLPRMAQDILWFNPLIHVIGMMRAGFYATYHPQYLSVPLVLVFALVPMVLGLLLLRRHHRELLSR